MKADACHLGALLLQSDGRRSDDAHLCMPSKDPPAQPDPASTSVMWTASKITAESRRIQQPRSLGTSLPADWILIIEPIVWAPLLITGPLCDGVRQGARGPQSSCQAWFPPSASDHTPVLHL